MACGEERRETKRKQAHPAQHLQKKFTHSILVKVVGIFKQTSPQANNEDWGEWTWVKITSEVKILDDLCTNI